MDGSVGTCSKRWTILKIVSIVLCSVLLLSVSAIPLTSAQLTGSSPLSLTPIFPSPLKQSSTGISTENVKCNNGFQVIGKRIDGSPACVTSDTFSRLISLGWGYDPIHELTFDGLKDTYKAGQEIDFGMKLKAYGNFWCTYPVVVANYENKAVWQSGLFVMGCPVITKKDFGYGEYEWHVGSNSGFSGLGTMILNQTGTYSIVVTWFKSPDVLIQKNITVTP
ncbi:MAG: hypothetical protein WA799_02690 [Nitrosotalea sp.]